jgi:hypothetical protein
VREVQEYFADYLALDKSVGMFSNSLWLYWGCIDQHLRLFCDLFCDMSRTPCGYFRESVGLYVCTNIRNMCVCVFCMEEMINTVGLIWYPVWHRFAYILFVHICLFTSFTCYSSSRLMSLGVLDQTHR